MSRRLLWIAAAILVLAAGAALMLWRRQAVGERPEATIEEAGPAAGSSPAARENIVAELFFPHAGGWLQSERREVAARDGAEAQIAALVETLIAGPQGAGLERPLPTSVTVRKVYVMDGEVVLDLESPEPPPPSGSRREMLTVYSLVNTVLLNTEGAERMVLLWNGQQPLTFAGHLDTARPLVANRGLIARDQAVDPS